MSLLSSLRRALTPKAAPRGEPPGPMQLGGLQLECPVCSYDLFSRRRIGTLDPRSVLSQNGQRVISLPAIACDRCGAVQLFDPTARSHPDAPIPPRRVARLHRRPEATVDDVADDGTAGDEGVAGAGSFEEAWTVAGEPAAGARPERDHEGASGPPIEWVGDAGTGALPPPPPSPPAANAEPDADTEIDPEARAWLEPGPGGDQTWSGDDLRCAEQGAVAPDAPVSAPPPPQDPGAAPPVWPTPLPPLPPLPPLDQAAQWGEDPPPQ